MDILQRVFVINFQLQTTFVIKIIIVVLNKSRMTLIINDKKIWMKEKINKIHFQSLIGHIHIVKFD
jgi:hypothetical protein